MEANPGGYKQSQKPIQETSKAWSYQETILSILIDQRTITIILIQIQSSLREKTLAFQIEATIMPPKTTWIEPKFRSALVIYDLSQEGYWF